METKTHFSSNLVKFLLLGFVVLIILCLIGILMYLVFWQKQNLLSNSPKQINSAIITKKITLYHKDSMRTLNVEIADDVEERRMGLMNRKELNQSDGMLFIFEIEDNQAFWMKNTYVPLDIIFFDAKKQYVNVVRNAQPCVKEDEVCPNYLSVYPAKYVLETRAGFLPEEYFTSDLKFTLE